MKHVRRALLNITRFALRNLKTSRSFFLFLVVIGIVNILFSVGSRLATAEEAASDSGIMPSVSEPLDQITLAGGRLPEIEIQAARLDGKQLRVYVSGHGGRPISGALEYPMAYQFAYGLTLKKEAEKLRPFNQFEFTMLDQSNVFVDASIPAPNQYVLVQIDPMMFADGARLILVFKNPGQSIEATRAWEVSNSLAPNVSRFGPATTVISSRSGSSAGFSLLEATGPFSGLGYPPKLVCTTTTTTTTVTTATETTASVQTAVTSTVVSATVTSDPHYIVTVGGRTVDFIHHGIDGHKYLLFSGNNVRIEGIYVPANNAQYIGLIIVRFDEGDVISWDLNTPPTFGSKAIGSSDLSLANGGTVSFQNGILTVQPSGGGSIQLSNNGTFFTFVPNGQFIGSDGILAKLMSLTARGVIMTDSDADEFDIP